MSQNLRLATKQNKHQPQNSTATGPYDNKQDSYILYPVTLQMFPSKRGTQRRRSVDKTLVSRPGHTLGAAHVGLTVGAFGQGLVASL